MAYLEFLKDVDVPVEMETQAYIDNFVFGIDQVNNTKNVIVSHVDATPRNTCSCHVRHDGVAAVYRLFCRWKHPTEVKVDLLEESAQHVCNRSQAVAGRSSF